MSWESGRDDDPACATRQATEAAEAVIHTTSDGLSADEAGDAWIEGLIWPLSIVRGSGSR